MKHLRFIVLLILPLCCTAEDHSFWDKQNIVYHSINGTVQTIDFLVTDHDLSLGEKEHNPLARPLVERGTGGRIVYSYGVGVGGTILISYLAHKKGWHKVERLIPISVSVSTMSVRIYYGIRF